MEALRVAGLSKSFGGVQALSDISFCVEVGERVGIIGPNGAGKTTLFNVLNGQFPATDGRIYLYGEDITSLPTHGRARHGQARSFQLTSLFPNLSIIDNVLLAIHGMERSRFQMLRSAYSYRRLNEKARDLLATIDLWAKRDESVNNLSHGEQRRLEIGLSLASEPKMLMLDEPSNGLTPEESSTLVGMIHHLGKEATILIIAHDLDLIFGITGRIIVLHFGQVIADGTPDEIRGNSRVREIYMGAVS